MSSGAIREIRRIYPAARITLLVRSAAYVLAETCPYVDELIEDPQKYNPTNLFEFYRPNVQTAARLLTQRFDLCFALALHPKTFLLMYMSGAKVRVAPINHASWDDFNKSKGLREVLMRLSTHLFAYGAHGFQMADRFYALLENMLHLPIANRKTDVWYTPAEVTLAKSLLIHATNPIYAFSMGGSTLRKHYPPEKYAKLLKMILR